MKRFLKVIILCFSMLTMCATAFTEESKKQKISFSLDFLNSGMLLGLNAEYSPNQYFDFGLGITPFAFFILPAMEAHVFARTCFLDYFIQPYLQIGASFVMPGQISSGTTDSNGYTTMNENWFNLRASAGVKFSFGKYFYCGVGGGYNFIGQNLVFLNWNGFYPALFVGVTPIRF